MPAKRGERLLWVAVALPRRLTMLSSPSTQQRSEALRELTRQVLAERSLILVSNRGPLEYHLIQDQLQPRRGSGTVVTALSSLMSSVGFSWVASAMGEGDRRAAELASNGHIKSPLPNNLTHVRFVVTPRRAYHKFYNIFCNPLLWFLQHSMWSPPYTPNIDSTVYDAWETGYVSVNRSFADEVLVEMQGQAKPPLIMLHDYHLYLVPGMIRERSSGALLHYFVHIPWPTARSWQLLPLSMRTAICQSLCACDVVGFQSSFDIHNFLESCQWFVPGAKVDYVSNTVMVGDHVTRVQAYPLSIDVDEVRQIANSPRALEYESRLKPLCQERTIVRVDRAEPNKNIVRGFRAYQLLLERHPELHGRVVFLAFLVPSRTHIKQYERYLQEIDLLVQSINTALGRSDWQPIQVFYENNYLQAIAALRICDVVLVNPVTDGMNLIAKEGSVVSTKNAVLVLSEGSSAYEQLKEGAITVAPADLEGTCQALYEAVTMPPEERARRAALLMKAIQREDVTHWLHSQFQDIKALL
ncbi:MAG: trehalose-6-phosphate synthase [Chloroflexi bacterium]|nr:trehalose-6-phosphate synthase [Chloroflexota bacterium]